MQARVVKAWARKSKTLRVNRAMIPKAIGAQVESG